ncbi:MAG TPA: hypothetical protein VIX58_10620, partial [Anaerolineae bacterium]
WLAQQPPGVILELPMLHAGTGNQLDLSRQYYSTYHWQSSPDGYSGFVPPRRGEIAYEMEKLPNDRALALLAALDIKYLFVHIDQFAPETRDDLNHALAVSRGLTFLRQFGSTWVYRVETVRGGPNMSTMLYVPNPVQAEAPFYAYLLLKNLNPHSFAVKPTDKLVLSARWNGGRFERVETAIPLVTSSASVVPILLHSPATMGPAHLELSSDDGLLGTFSVASEVSVGKERASEVPVPARVGLARPLRRVYSAGESMAIDLTWRAENKIDAYYSFSLRVVDARGNKIVAEDRQPNPPTLLWRPEENYVERVNLTLPANVAPGRYRLELLLYQADDDVSVLLLDDQNVPLNVIELGEIEVTK